MAKEVKKQKKHIDKIYKNCSITLFKKILENTQRTKSDYWWFTPKYTFLYAVELDKVNWKKELKAEKVKDSDLKIKALIERFDFNQTILMDAMIQEGKSNIIWQTMYISEYNNQNNNDEAVNQININISNSKTGKLEIKKDE